MHWDYVNCTARKVFRKLTVYELNQGAFISALCKANNLKFVVVSWFVVSLNFARNVIVAGQQTHF